MAQEILAQEAFARASNYLVKQGTFQSDLEWSNQQIPVVQAKIDAQLGVVETAQFNYDKERTALDLLNQELT